MGPEIIYVSGRTRASGEMNGKSANLNNCLGQIYPAGTRIPPTELACVFDDDQARPKHGPLLLPSCLSSRPCIAIIILT